MSKPLVVVTGKNGQLGWEIAQLRKLNEFQFDFLFIGRDELDLSNPITIPLFFKKQKPQYFINCAAYTLVDKAETEKEAAFAVNATSVGIIATECAAIGCTLITISTDYVFDGNGTAPYLPNQATDPLNYYGFSKREGEVLAQTNNPKTIIIRTSWVYSTHGNNFVKTMLRLTKERPELKVVSDQIGSPTYAADLAEVLIKIVEQLEAGNTHYGIYHYSNSGVISWFDFASAINITASNQCKVFPIPSALFPTPAKRPAYSVLNKQTITNDFGIKLIDWKISLKKCLGSM